jgi:hypothetical protein
VARKVNISLAAPTGTTFAGPATVERTTVDRETFAIARPAVKGLKVEKDRAAFDAEMPEHSAWKVTIPLAGKLADKPQVVRRQFFSPDILGKATRDKPFVTRIKLDPAALKNAKRAWLRTVLEDVGVGEGTVTVGSGKHSLPYVMLPDNVARIVNVPLDPKALSPDNEVTFSAGPGNFAGYRVDMASIVLEQRE